MRKGAPSAARSRKSSAIRIQSYRKAFQHPDCTPPIRVEPRFDLEALVAVTVIALQQCVVGFLDLEVQLRRAGVLAILLDVPEQRLAQPLALVIRGDSKAVERDRTVGF